MILVHHSFRSLLLAAVLLAAGAPLSAGVGLLVAEPFGKFGFFNPTGHAAIYLSSVCAETPTSLRPCLPGENGVVISRYRRVAGYDWLAIPLLPYLYAVDSPEEVPEFADAPAAALLRDSYRRAKLHAIVPDGPDGEAPKGDWVQLVGAAYDRNIYGYFLESTPEEDERLISLLHSRPNRSRFNLFYRNCVDFARDIVNFYYPGALRRSFLADLGISTPKHAAKSLVAFGRRNSEFELAQFVVPQVEGARPSTRARGVAESLIRSKKYVVPLAIFQPWVAVSAAVAYIGAGRFNPERQQPAVCRPRAMAECLTIPGDAPPPAAASLTESN